MFNPTLNFGGIKIPTVQWDCHRCNLTDLEVLSCALQIEESSEIWKIPLVITKGSPPLDIRNALTACGYFSRNKALTLSSKLSPNQL